MAFTGFQLFLALLMVVTGSLNTLTTKWADQIQSKDSHNKVTPFNHPFVQAMFMFFGEMMCLVTFKIVYFFLKRKQDGSEDRSALTKGNRDFNVFVLFVPAMLDMIGTSTMYVGLTLTFASSFQMLRGSVIVFVAILSIVMLRRRLGFREWSGILFIIIGLSLVGLADFSGGSGKSQHDIILGDLLIVLAQVITASQMVWEEKFVAGKDIPALQAVGYEGLFGFIVLGLALIPMYWIKVAPFNEDAIDAFTQIYNNPFLIMAICGTIVSIAFFNYAGISVTKEISATTRMVLDSIRTFVIWMVSLGLSWQAFHYLQVIGFSGLLCGMFVYNDMIITPLFRKCCSAIRNRRQGADTEPIINQNADE